MRDYAQVRPRFWTHGTGKALREDPLAQLVALYLMTAPSSNLIGLYYLPLPTLVHETGLPPQGAMEALARLSREEFARYDHPSEYVWVVNMAAQQLGERLELADNRRAGVMRELERHRASPFYGDFLEKYRAPFSLDAPLKGSVVKSSFEGASKGLSRVRTGSGSGSGERTGERERRAQARGTASLSLAKSPSGGETESPSAPRLGSAEPGEVVPARAADEFTAEAMRELFRVLFLQLRNDAAKLDGNGTEELYERVIATAQARSVDARALFVSVAHRWIAGELNDRELAAPYACFAAAWSAQVERMRGGRSVDPKTALMRRSADALRAGDRAAYDAAERELAQLMGGGHAAAGE